MGKKKTFLVGHVNVESGFCQIGDPSAILDAEKYKEMMQPPGISSDGYFALMDDAERSHPEPLDGAPRALALEPLGEGQGLVFPAGYGDGQYPVYITLDNNGRVEAAYISFRLQ